MEWSALQPVAAGATLIVTCPCAVNLNAFDKRFFKICCSRFGSVVIARGSDGSNSTWNGRLFESAMCRKLRSTESRSEVKPISSASTVTVPDSIFDKSKMSVMRFSKSEPEE